MFTRSPNQSKLYKATYLFVLISACFHTAVWASSPAITVCADDCDFSSLQAAVNAATEGDLIEVGAGNYALTTSLNLNKSDITITGAGRDETIIDASAVNGYGVLWTGSNITVNDLTVVGPSANIGSAYGLKIQAPNESGAPVSGVRINRVTVQGSGRTEIDLNFADDVQLTDITVDGQDTAGIGVGMISTTNITLERLTTLGNNWGAIGVFTNPSTHYAAATSSNNITVTDLDAAETIVLYGQGTNGGQISGLVAPQLTHTVRNPDYRANATEFTHYRVDVDDAVAFALQLDAPAQSLVREIETGNLIVGDQMSLQNAVTAATTGTTIEVLNGTYGPVRTSINGPENITIRAATGHSPVITGEANPKRLLDLRADGTVLDGFEIIAPADHVAVSVVGRNLLIENNTVTAGLTGIITNTQYPQGQNIIRNNTISGVTAGISLQNAGNEVTGNTVSAGLGVGNYGVADNEADGIRGNIIENNSFQSKASVWRTGTQLDIPTGTGLLNAILDNNSFTGPLVAALTPDDHFRPSEEVIGGADINNFRIYDAIQSAIDVAMEGDTVGVSAAIYQENIQIDKSVTLRGNETGVVIAPATGRGISIMGNTAVDVIDSVRIENLTVRGNSGEYAIIALSNANGMYDTTNLTLNNIVIESNAAGYSLGLFDVDGADLSNVRITGHTSNIVGALELVGVRNLSIEDSDLGTSALSLHIFEATGYMTNGDVIIIDSKLATIKAIGTTTNVDARSNWWGRAQGPTADTTGNVQFTPWYVNAGMTQLSAVQVVPEPEPDPVPTPTPTPAPTPTPGPVQDVVTNIVIPEVSNEPITQETVNAVQQAANTAAQAANVVTQNLDTVTTSQAISALSTIGDVVKVSGAASQNATNSGNSGSSTSTANSGSSALNSFSTVLGALDQKNRSQNTELTAAEKTTVQSAAVTAVSSAINILAAMEDSGQKKSVLSNLGKVITSSVNLGVPLNNEQSNALLTATEQATNPDSDLDDQLETSIPLKPVNRALISRDDLVQATGLSSDVVDEFLAELAEAINPADINIGGVSGQDAISDTFSAATGGSISFDSATGTLFFVIPVSTPPSEDTDGVSILALSTGEVRVPTRMISSNVVSSSYPEGMTSRADGAFVLTSNRIASVIVPAPYDAIGFHSDMRKYGFTSRIRDNGNLIIRDGEYVYSGTFDFTGLRTDGEPSDVMSYNTPAGADESDPDFVFEITYRDGTRQTIQPFVAAPGFVSAIRSYGMTISINRDTGIVTVDGAQFRPGYLVIPHSSESLAFWQLNKDEHGIAFQAVDINGDGKMDYQVMHDTGVQVVYGL